MHELGIEKKKHFCNYTFNEVELPHPLKSLDITCSPVPDIELVCIWFRLDSMSIFVSIVKHAISFYNYHVFALFP